MEYLYKTCCFAMRTPLAWHIFGEHYLYANESNEQQRKIKKKPKVLQLRETLKCLFAVDDDFVMRMKDNDQCTASFWYTIQTDTVLTHPFVYYWLNGRKCTSRATQMSENSTGLTRAFPKLCKTFKTFQQGFGQCVVAWIIPNIFMQLHSTTFLHILGMTKFNKTSLILLLSDFIKSKVLNLNLKYNLNLVAAL